MPDHITPASVAWLLLPASSSSVGPSRHLPPAPGARPSSGSDAGCTDKVFVPVTFPLGPPSGPSEIGTTDSFIQQILTEHVLCARTVPGAAGRTKQDNGTSVLLAKRGRWACSVISG